MIIVLFLLGDDILEQYTYLNRRIGAVHTLNIDNNTVAKYLCHIDEYVVTLSGYEGNIEPCGFSHKCRISHIFYFAAYVIDASRYC